MITSTNIACRPDANDHHKSPPQVPASTARQEEHLADDQSSVRVTLPDPEPHRPGGGGGSGGETRRDKVCPGRRRPGSDAELIEQGRVEYRTFGRSNLEHSFPRFCLQSTWTAGMAKSGRRDGLKIHWGQLRAGSNPAPGTDVSCRLLTFQNGPKPQVTGLLLPILPTEASRPLTQPQNGGCAYLWGAGLGRGSLVRG